MKAVVNATPLMALSLINKIKLLDELFDVDVLSQSSVRLSPRLIEWFKA
jgi:hypothetical protein